MEQNKGEKIVEEEKEEEPETNDETDEVDLDDELTYKREDILDLISELNIESNTFYETSIKKLWIILENIAKNPKEPKYKTLKFSN